MKIRIDDVIEKYGMDYAGALNLDVEGRNEGRAEISFEEAMNLHGRGILVDKEQDIYTNDLAQEERKRSILAIFEFVNS
jgi:hypothetical protein